MDPKTFTSISSVNYLFYTLTTSPTAIKNMVLSNYLRDKKNVREIPSDEILAQSPIGFHLYCTLCHTWTITYSCDNGCDTCGCATCVRNEFRSCLECGLRKCPSCIENEDFECNQCGNVYCHEHGCGEVWEWDGKRCEECCEGLCLKCSGDKILMECVPKGSSCGRFVCTDCFCLEGHCKECGSILKCSKCNGVKKQK